MPIYEYQCNHCHHEFDLMQKVNDPHEKVCPKCHKETAVRLVSAAGFQLKGTGWYATDFKDKKPTPKKDESGSENNSTKEKKETKSTTTTEGKKD